ncbi:hypothetical protein C8R44DRAFT_62639 [Mycena epipterygia]|nr:hypothetical protein C8R44DRAFT_62639 [Mycena epipterygia]
MNTLPIVVEDARSIVATGHSLPSPSPSTYVPNSKTRTRTPCTSCRGLRRAARTPHAPQRPRPPSICAMTLFEHRHKPWAAGRQLQVRRRMERRLLERELADWRAHVEHRDAHAREHGGSIILLKSGYKGSSAVGTCTVQMGSMMGMA